MTDMFKLQVRWAGLAGMPGTTTWYSTDIPPVAAVKTFFTDMASSIPTGVTWTIPGSGDKVRDTDGALVGAWSSGDNETVSSSGSGAYSAPVGFVVRYTTATIVNRRRVRGRFFMVPIIASQFDTSGNILNTSRATWETRAQTLTSAFAGSLVVWARPFTPQPGDDTPARLGSTAVVTGTTIPDMAAVLRSRRD